MRDPNHLRTCWFRPYRKGYGPSFRLDLFDTNRYDSMGKSILRYVLTEYARESVAGKVERTEIFAGDDFACSPMHAVDSDDSVAGLMTFLTLKPGDTDSDYFDDYNDVQRDFAASHADSVSMVCLDRFGER